MTQSDWVLFSILACIWTVSASHFVLYLWRKHDGFATFLISVVIGVITVGAATGLINLLKDTCL